jgi:hypothetical protein
MPIKYGELTIIHDKEQLSIFSNLLLWFNYELYEPNKSKCIYLFEDGEIYDEKNKLEDLKFNFTEGKITITSSPSYFKKNIIDKTTYNPIYFSKIEKKDNKYCVSSKELFCSYSKYNVSITIPSIYNCVYWCYKSAPLKKEVFGLIRIKSNEYMPRFLFAYDNDEFTKNEVMYLINYMLNPLDKKNE